MLEAIRILKERYNGEVAVVSTIVGPLSLLGMLLGFEKTFLTLMDRHKYTPASLVGFGFRSLGSPVLGNQQLRFFWNQDEPLGIEMR